MLTQAEFTLIMDRIAQVTMIDLDLWICQKETFQSWFVSGNVSLEKEMGSFIAKGYLDPVLLRDYKFG